MKFNRVLTLVFVGVFVALLGRALLQKKSDPDATKHATTEPSGGPAGPPAGELTLLLSSSNAKQTFIDKAVADFNALKVTVGDKVVKVQARHVNSGDSWNDLREGRLKPDLWSPGDDSWIRIANGAWRALYNKPLFDRVDPLVNVPLCIAMWEPMAVALGYPKPLGWADLARVSADPRGWARLGHPEWGPMKWGHAHPDANSGFLTVVSEVYAHTRKTKGLTVADLKSPGLTAYLKTVEGSVEHYGLSSVWIDTFMREKGPAYLSAAVQYENAIIEGNRRTNNSPFKIVAIYPKEGTFITQHPIGIPQGDWMTDERKSAAQKFIDHLLKPETQQQAMTLGVRPINPSITVGEPFSDAWGVQAKLPAIPAFEVPDEDILKRITDLWLDAKKPASVMMLIDVSGSMNGDPMNRAREGAVAFIERMHARDELEIRAFNHEITKLYGPATIASGGEAARDKVRGLFAAGGTHLYEVIRQAVLDWNARKKKSPGRHYGIVLLTDGRDEGSNIRRADLMDVLPRGDNPDTVKIFTIAYGQGADQLFLKEIANTSNARSFESNPTNIVRVYQELSANF